MSSITAAIVDEARAVKTEALAAWLTRNGFTAAVAAAMSDGNWRDVAGLCRVNPPSQTTREMVVGRMQIAECRRAEVAG